jgi:hypothetical protein
MEDQLRKTIAGSSTRTFRMLNKLAKITIAKIMHPVATMVGQSIMIPRVAVR